MVDQWLWQQLGKAPVSGQDPSRDDLRPDPVEIDRAYPVTPDPPPDRAMVTPAGRQSGGDPLQYIASGSGRCGRGL